jgi:hypothetical protein
MARGSMPLRRDRRSQYDLFCVLCASLCDLCVKNAALKQTPALPVRHATSGNGLRQHHLPRMTASGFRTKTAAAIIPARILALAALMFLILTAKPPYQTPARHGAIRRIMSAHRQAANR